MKGLYGQERVEVKGKIFQFDQDFGKEWSVSEVKFGGVLYEVKRRGTLEQCKEYIELLKASQ